MRSPNGSATGTREQRLQRFPLRVEGGKIVDAQGQRFRFKGVNWYGASDVEHVVGGLAKRRLRDIADTVANLGFSVVRLPFSNEMLRPDTEISAGAIDFDLNPELKGLRPIEVFDAVVDALGASQVAVIPNNHCSFGAWGGDVDANGLWFCAKPAGEPSREYSEEDFLRDWVHIAERYKDRPWVVGYDLRNEVRPVPGRPTLWPVWNAGARSTPWILPSARVLRCHDWRAASGRVGAAVLQVQPTKLIVVERIVMPAQSLRHYVDDPPEGIPTSQLVWSVHCYGWSGPGLYIPRFEKLGGWNEHGSRRKSVFDFVRTSVLGRSLGGCRDARNYWEMSATEQLEWYRHQWGEVIEQSAAPVWINEFGVGFQANSDDRRWFETFMSYVNDIDADYAYWPLNGGPKPSGKGEPYGLLDTEWRPHEEDWRCAFMAP